MSLTDEQLQQAIIDGVKAGKISWLGYKKDDEGRFTIPVISKSDMQLSRAIESAATAPLLERIAELEQRCQDNHEDMLRFRRHALDEKDARMALERELEAVRKDADRWAMSRIVSKEALTPPEKRQHQNVLNAYFKATGAGLDWVAAIDTAIDAAKEQG